MYVVGRYFGHVQMDIFEACLMGHMAGNHTSCKQWGVLGQTKKSKNLQTNRKLLEADKERWEKARIASV